MPNKDGTLTPEEWAEATGENGSVYIGVPAKKVDPLLDRLMSVKQWPVDLRESDEDEDGQDK